MNDWSRLSRELDLWQACRRTATFWLRDDDARQDSPALRRLLDIAQASEVAVALAVIPAGIAPSLMAAIQASVPASVVQHGYAHRNYSPPDARSCELGAHRPVDQVLDELAVGYANLARDFGERWVAMLVPPWNRIDAEVIARLPGAGYRSLSTFGTRKQALAAPGLALCNTHVDLVAWRKDRGFIGDDAAIERLVAHLQARRLDAADAAEVTGVLTHHLVLDAAAWQFLDQLLIRTRAHPAARWLDAASVADVECAQTA